MAGEGSDRAVLDQINEIDPGDLVLDALIGSGATADVFKADWLGKTVAVKQLVEQTEKRHINDQVALVREAAALAGLNHPNLVKCFGVVLSARPFQIVTEYCEGRSCTGLLHEEHSILTWAQRHKIALDAARGVNYLHCHKPQIIHRDLKSGNLLLAKPVLRPEDIPHVKVSDFGFARINPQESWSHLKLTCVGTRRWMAPEVTSGSYDAKVDVYSFAMVLFEIVASEDPFHDVRDDEIMKLIQSGVRPDTAAIRPNCPAALVALMEACWAHDPQERPSFSEITPQLESMSLPKGV